MFYFWPFFVANRSVMWQSMEALVPGQAGPHVVITMEAARGPVCVGHEPVITPPLSVVASSATASAWKSPTAPGKLSSDAPPHLCKSFSCLCWQEREMERLGDGNKNVLIHFLHPRTTYSCCVLHIQCQLFGEQVLMGCFCVSLGWHITTF